MNLILEQRNMIIPYIVICVILAFIIAVPLIKRIGKWREKKRIMVLARDMREWNIYELKGEEKKLNDKIIHNNGLLSLLNCIPSITTRENISIPQDLEYKEPFPYQYPWKHVADSLLQYPDKVVFNHSLCPDCKRQRIGLFFCSPDFTWRKLCGVAGDMVICPHCKKQMIFIETRCN